MARTVTAAPGRRSARSAARGPGPGGARLLRLDATRSLAAYFGVGGLLCWVACLLTHARAVDTPVVAGIGCAAVAVAVTLVAVGAVPSWLRVVLVAAGTVLIASLVAAGRGTAESIGFATFIVWVAVYSACFFSARTAAVETVVGIGAIGVAWAWSGQPWLALLLAAATAVTTALVVGDLVQRVRTAAERDPLTGLATYAGLVRRGAPVLAAAAGTGEPVAVLLLQLRGLGQVVESLGHAAGEELVARAGSALAANEAGTLVIGARIAGDRLAVIVPAFPLEGCRVAGIEAGGSPRTLTAGAVWAAQEMLRLIRGPHRLAGVDLQLEGHVGVAFAGQVAGDLPALLQAGEAALAEAVHRDTPVQLYEDRLAVGGAEELQLLAELRDAIPAGQLRVHYQVQVAARTGRTASVEALVRWEHPRRGLLAPGMFLPVAEPTNVILDLTRWVLDESLRQCATWLAAGRRVPVSVNLSARLLTHPPVLEEITALLAVHAVPPELLTIEVTETALVAHATRAAEFLRALRDHGIRTSLDDFGTGQTSLAMLAGLPFDELKIDRGFVTDGRLDPRAEAVVASVLHLGHGLGQQVVAEGVEDEDTARWLAGLGCDLLQGYHHGRPCPAAALTELPRTLAPTGTPERSGPGPVRGRRGTAAVAR